MPTVLVARTDALSATLITSDVDERDHAFLTGERTPEGYFRVEGGIESAIARGLAYAPYADLIWCETSTPDLGEAREFAEAIHAQFPGKLLAYNCSPSFNWKRHLDDDDDRALPGRARRDGLRVPVHHAGRLPRAQRRRCSSWRAATAAEGMTAYVELQEREFELEEAATRRRATSARSAPATSTWSPRRSAGGESSTLALKGSTEEAQFHALGEGRGAPERRYNAPGAPLRLLHARTKQELPPPPGADPACTCAGRPCTSASTSATPGRTSSSSG